MTDGHTEMKPVVHYALMYGEDDHIGNFMIAGCKQRQMCGKMRCLDTYIICCHLISP